MVEAAGETEHEFRRSYKLWRKNVTQLHKAGELEAAASKVELMARRYPHEPEVQRAVADFYLSTNQNESAIEALQEVLRYDPSHRKSRLLLWRALRGTDRHDETVEVLAPLAAELPRAPLLTELGVLCRRLQRFDEAESALRQVVERNPNYRDGWKELVGLLEETGRQREAEEARLGWEAIPAKLTPADVVERIDAEHPDDAERYVVNMGCRDGLDMGDPCYDLYQRGYAGLAVDAGDFQDLYRNLPQPDVTKLLNTFVTPDNVTELMNEAGCPVRHGLLKVDIDSYDGVVLEAALEKFEPNVIHVEVNPEIPPPIRFAIHYDPRYRHSGEAGFFGCSVAYVVSICRPKGYELLQIDFTTPPSRQDVILVKEKYLPLWGIEAPVDERKMFLAEPVVVGRFWEAGIDSPAWREESDYRALLSDIWDACVAGSEKRSGEVLPFVLTL